MKQSFSRLSLTTLCLLLSTLLLAGCFKKAALPQKSRPTINEPVNTVPISDRVYTTLTVKRDGKKPLGKELVLSIADSKGATLIEYDVEVQSGTTIQGDGGEIDPKKGQKPFGVDLFLGTCSAGGACSYYKDIKGGSIVLRFNGSSVGALKGEWSYAEPSNDGVLSSRDGKFQLSAPKLKQGFVIIGHTIGLPKPIDGEVLAGPYNIDTTATPFGDGALTIHLTGDDVSKATLWMWDGSNYQKPKSTLSGKTLTATISAPGTYLVTK